MFHHGSGGVSHRLLLNRGWAVHPIRPRLFTVLTLELVLSFRCIIAIRQDFK